MTTGTGRSPRHLFETADPAERQRLDPHAQLWDPFTFRKLAETGVGDGWRCLENGAGTGTVAAWLAGRVGATGLVVATDIETRWLEPVAGTNLEVRRHDVAAEPVHGDGYDLIHARLVLEHLPTTPRWSPSSSPHSGPAAGSSSRTTTSASGTDTADQLDATPRAYDDRDHPTTTFTPILVAASGRRPTEHHVG